ncbi:hypothetical protein [Microbulbifer sp.]|uniref:hypothetical protein n=1 Tax=Microbulbifer sp. TaxID=1908541 RepID=UPI003F34BE07
MRNSEITPGLGTTLDATTTYYGLAHAGATEANPLLSWGNPVTTALGSIAIKQGVKYAAVNYMHADPFTVDTNVESAGVAAGIWNIGALAGVNPVLGLAAAITTAYGYYQYRVHSHAVEQARNPGYATDEGEAEQREQNRRVPLLATQAKKP